MIFDSAASVLQRPSLSESDMKAACGYKPQLLVGMTLGLIFILRAILTKTYWLWQASRSRRSELLLPVSLHSLMVANSLNQQPQVPLVLPPPERQRFRTTSSARSLLSIESCLPYSAVPQTQNSGCSACCKPSSSQPPVKLPWPPTGAPNPFPFPPPPTHPPHTHTHTHTTQPSSSPTPGLRSFA